MKGNPCLTIALYKKQTKKGVIVFTPNTDSKSKHIQVQVNPWLEFTRASLAAFSLGQRIRFLMSRRHSQGVFSLGVPTWEWNKAFHFSET